MKYAVQNYTKVDSDTEFGITWGEESKRISFCVELVGFQPPAGEKWRYSEEVDLLQQGVNL